MFTFVSNNPFTAQKSERLGLSEILSIDVDVSCSNPFKLVNWGLRNTFNPLPTDLMFWKERKSSIYWEPISNDAFMSASLLMFISSQSPKARFPPSKEVTSWKHWFHLLRWNLCCRLSPPR
jgi:hypothetical protein